MTTLTQTDDAVRQKTLELCEAIVSEPRFVSIRQRVDAFMANPAAQNQYHNLSEKGRALHERQHQGLTLDPKEIAAFDTERDAFLANPIAKGFIDAQEEMHELQHEVQQMVTKTFELGKVPSEADLQEEEGGSCGSGCGCHH